MAKFKDEAKANLAVRGANPQNWGDAKPGWVYIIEPKSTSGGVPIGKPTKARFEGIDKDGRPEFSEVK